MLSRFSSRTSCIRDEGEWDALQGEMNQWFLNFDPDDGAQTTKKKKKITSGAASSGSNPASAASFFESLGGSPPQGAPSEEDNDEEVSPTADNFLKPKPKPKPKGAAKNMQLDMPKDNNKGKGSAANGKGGKDDSKAYRDLLTTGLNVVNKSLRLATVRLAVIKRDKLSKPTVEQLKEVIKQGELVRKKVTGVASKKSVLRAEAKNCIGDVKTWSKRLKDTMASAKPFLPKIGTQKAGKTDAD